MDLRQFLQDAIINFFHKNKKRDVIYIGELGGILAKKDKGWKKRYNVHNLTSALKSIEDLPIYSKILSKPNQLPLSSNSLSLSSKPFHPITLPRYDEKPRKSFSAKEKEMFKLDQLKAPRDEQNSVSKIKDESEGTQIHANEDSPLRLFLRNALSDFFKEFSNQKTISMGQLGTILLKKDKSWKMTYNVQNLTTALRSIKDLPICLKIGADFKGNQKNRRAKGKGQKKQTHSTRKQVKMITPREKREAIVGPYSAPKASTERAILAELGTTTLGMMSKEIDHSLDFTTIKTAKDHEQEDQIKQSSRELRKNAE